MTGGNGHEAGFGVTVFRGRHDADNPRPWGWRFYVGGVCVETSTPMQGCQTYEEASAVGLERLLAHLRNRATQAYRDLETVSKSLALSPQPAAEGAGR